MYEKQIDLKDLFFKILYRWRMLLVAMVVGGVIFGVYGYVSIQNEIEEKVGDTGKNYLMYLTEAEAAKIDYYLEYEKQYLIAEENFENSVIQKMDESNIYTLNNVYTVICDDLDRAYIMEKAYEQCLESNEFYEKVAEACDEIEVSDVPKFFYVEKDNTNIDTGRLAFTASFWFEGEEKCKAVGDVITDYVNELALKFQDVYGEGNVELLSSEVSKSNPSGLVNSKLAELASFQDMENTYLELKNGIAKEKIKIYKQNEINISKMVYVKKIVIGIMLFFIIAVIVITFKYLMDNNIKNESEIADVYKIPVLGVINKDRKNKKIFGIIDNIIAKIEKGKKQILGKEESEEIISTQISLICQKNELSDIGIVECNINNETNEICDEIASKIENNKINAKVISKIMHNPKEMLKINEISGAVLAVTLNETKEDNFEEQLNILKRQGIEILGCVVIN